MNRISVCIFAIMTCMLMCCCERRPLEELYTEEALIPVEFDWSKSTLDVNTDHENLYNSSIHIYSTDGSKPFNGSSHKEFVFNSPMGGIISLPVGSYRCIAINNSVDNFDTGSFFDRVDDYNGFTYGARKSSNGKSATGLMEPNILCAWHTSTLTVTPNMVKSSNDLGYPMSDAERLQAEKDLRQLVGITPERLTRHVHVTFHVRNLRSATSASGRMLGLSSSVEAVSCHRSVCDCFHSFGFSDITMDSDNPKNGTMKADFEIIGIEPSQSHTMEVRFKLTECLDGSYYYPSEDKPAYRFNLDDYLSGSSDIDIYIDLSIDDLPDLKVGGGFIPDVGDWGEDEWVEIPV